MRILENIILRNWQIKSIEGKAVFNKEVFNCFFSAPYDILENFQGPPGTRLKGGRGKDHPRYGRFAYCFAKYYRPGLIVEVGTYAGGTAVGWARAVTENGIGRLICVDNDTYSKGTYPEIALKNIKRTGIKDDQFQLRAGDSKLIIPEISLEFPMGVDIYLVDGDHTYEGALADLSNGLPMVKFGGFVLVHDVDRGRRMDEMTEEHPYPVYEAFMEIVKQHGFEWCILKFIRKHLGILKVN